MLARFLGPEGRGLFALVLLLPELVRSFGLLGFEQANAVYAGIDPAARRSLVWQSAAIAGVVGGIAVVIGICGLTFASPLQSLVRGPLWLYLLPLVIVPGGLLVDYWGSILRGMNHILLLNVVEVGTKVASLAFVVVFVVRLRLDVAGAVWADFAVNVGAVFLMMIL